MNEAKKSCCSGTGPAESKSGCCSPRTEDVAGCKDPSLSAPVECCPPETQGDPIGNLSELKDQCCCPPQELQTEIAGYCLYPFVAGWIDSAIGKIPQVSCKLTWSDRRGRWSMRWGFGRDHYSLTPGLYAIGQPDQNSPLLVSANYKLSFDCLRAELAGENAWILVIDTKGVNVWCAAGKGTFGSEEIIRRCRQVRLTELVSHRTLVIPQLGAPGVSAFKVKQETGFSVVYGPVRSKDLKAFFTAKMEATEAMRQVSFSTMERLILTPVEITVMRKTIFLVALALFVLSGIGSDIFSFSAAWHRGLTAVGVCLVGVLTGCILTPVLLPWIPTRAFAGKGALLGLISATVLALGPFRNIGFSGLSCLYLTVIAVSSYTAMNFTGSTTFTSPSGVEKEMRFAIPCQAVAILIAGLIWIGAAF